MVLEVEALIFSYRQHSSQYKKRMKYNVDLYGIEIGTVELEAPQRGRNGKYVKKCLEK